MDVAKQILYWRTGFDDDWRVAGILFAKREFRHALFFAHLSLEKALKALAVRHTRETPPRTHNLLRIAELAAVTLTPEQQEFLRAFDRYQMEGRYPNSAEPVGEIRSARDDFAEAEKFLEWLRKQFC